MICQARLNVFIGDTSVHEIWQIRFEASVFIKITYWVCALLPLNKYYNIIPGDYFIRILQNLDAPELCASETKQKCKRLVQSPVIYLINSLVQSYKTVQEICSHEHC